MKKQDHDTRQLILWLDDAIDEYDCSLEGTQPLWQILEAIAETTCNEDPGFASRVRRVATRSSMAVEPSQRDIASALARDIRRDLMCSRARRSGSRNLCALNASSARTLRRRSTTNQDIAYLGE